MGLTQVFYTCYLAPNLFAILSWGIIITAENLLRENLSAMESIGATIEIIDVEMEKDGLCLTVGKTPLERVHKLLSTLDFIRVSKGRESMVSKETDLFHKYVEQVEHIFNNLPKPLKWQAFLRHYLILLTDIPYKVQKASVKYNLNKAQIKALARLEWRDQHPGQCIQRIVSMVSLTKIIKPFFIIVFFCGLWLVPGYNGNVWGNSVQVDYEKSDYVFGVFPFILASRLEGVFAPLAKELSIALDTQVHYRSTSTFEKFMKRLESSVYDIALIQPR